MCQANYTISHQSLECKHDMSVATFSQPATLYKELVECMHRGHLLKGKHDRLNLMQKAKTKNPSQSHED